MEAEAPFLLTVALAAFFITPAMAQQICGKRADIVKRLSEGFQEQRRSEGITADGKLVEIFTSKGGSWTITLTKPGGLMCLVAVGDSWQRIDDPQGHPI